MASRSDFYWDLLVDNRNGQLTLVVEIKRKTNVSPEWAVQFRRNLLAHGTAPKAPYFLMAFPDKFYLWTEAEAHLEPSEPTYTIDARPLLGPYFKRAGVTAEQISPQSFELIVASWLAEIVHSEQVPENLEDSKRWLLESGLYASLAGGQFVNEAAA